MGAVFLVQAMADRWRRLRNFVATAAGVALVVCVLSGTSFHSAKPSEPSNAEGSLFSFGDMKARDTQALMREGGTGFAKIAKKGAWKGEPIIPIYRNKVWGDPLPKLNTAKAIENLCCLADGNIKMSDEGCVNAKCGGPSAKKKKKAPPAKKPNKSKGPSGNGAAIHTPVNAGGLDDRGMDVDAMSRMQTLWSRLQQSVHDMWYDAEYQLDH